MLPQADLEHVLARTEGIWRALAGSRFYISGGTGFIGKWLLESLLWANQRLGAGITASVLSRNPEAFLSAYAHFRSPALTFEQGDIRKPLSLHGCDVVINAASDSDDRKNSADPLAMLDSIVDGSRNVIEAAIAARSRYVLMLSSGSVYGDQPAHLDRLPEDYGGAPALHAPTAKAFNGEGKRMMEMLACHHAQRSGLQVTMARCFAFLGPYLALDRHFAAGNFMRDALRGDEIRLSGDGSAVRSYMHPADLVVWLMHILHRGVAGRSYNVGSETSVTTLELAQRISSASAKRPAVRCLGAPSDAPANCYVPSTERARIELGLALHIDLESAIRRTLDWHLGNDR